MQFLNPALLAGTLLVREERVDLDKYTAPVEAASVPALVGQAPRLASRDTELILSYLSRASWLEPDARARLGARLVERYGGLDAARREALLASPGGVEAFLRARIQAER